MDIKPIIREDAFAWALQKQGKATQEIFGTFPFGLAAATVADVAKALFLDETNSAFRFSSKGNINMTNTQVLLNSFSKEKMERCTELLNNIREEYYLNLNPSMGLPNLNNTCWINSALKFMAGDEWFLGLCNASLGDNQENEALLILKEMQSNLENIFKTLRDGKMEACLDKQLYKKFVNALQEKENYAAKQNKRLANNFTKEQFDAVEFIRILASDFNYPGKNCSLKKLENNCAKQLVHYTLSDDDPAHKGYTKKPTIEDFCPILEIKIPSEIAHQKAPLDLANLLNNPDTKEVRPNYHLGYEVYYDAPSLSFQTENVLINAPEILRISISRFLKNDSGEEEKCSLGIKFDKDNRLTLIEYDQNSVTLNACQTGTVADPKNVCVYEVVAALHHASSLLGEGGHWTCIEATDKGFLYHNDESVTWLSRQEASLKFQKASLLRLKLVSKTPYQSL